MTRSRRRIIFPIAFLLKPDSVSEDLGDHPEHGDHKEGGDIGIEGEFLERYRLPCGICQRTDGCRNEKRKEKQPQAGNDLIRERSIAFHEFFHKARQGYGDENQTAAAERGEKEGKKRISYSIGAAPEFSGDVYKRFS